MVRFVLTFLHCAHDNSQGRQLLHLPSTRQENTGDLFTSSDSQSLGPAIHFSRAASKLFANTFHCTPSISTHLLAVYLWSLLPQRGSHSQTSLAWTLFEIHKERNTHPKPSVPCPVITGFKAQKRRMPALTGTKHSWKQTVH